MYTDDINEKRKDMIFDFISSKEYFPMKIKEMAAFLNVPKQEKELFKETVDKLISEGKVICDSKGRIKPAGDDSVTGTFCGTTRGFGFVRTGEENEDIFIPPDYTLNAHDGDKVLVKLSDQSRGQSREGVVIKVLERADKDLIGTFTKNKKSCFVIPDNRKYGSDIYIPQEYTQGAVNGHKVIVELTDFGSPDRNPEGRVTEIIGHVNDPGTDILSVVKAYGIPTDFSSETLAQLASVPQEVTEKDLAGRLDLRQLPTVTIDGEDTKDFDDAVSLTVDGQGIYHLGVHIADVSEYVRENSPLDKDALSRGTSNYLIDKVIPMLPYQLSNGICSLNEGCDRLTLSCLMDIDPKGQVIGHNIAASVINVDHRMTYTSVKKIIEDHDAEEIAKYPDFADSFIMMDKVAGLLRQNRFQRGSIDFDIPECKITVDAQGKPVDIRPYERNRAHRLIEDFMLIANETVAEDYFWQDMPFVYRTHESPDPDKIKRLCVFINNFGFTLRIPKDEIHPKEIQKLLQQIEGTEEENLISRITLRSMKQAKYTVNCDGHFGLAAKYYCHFTSPIRRYPDLQIHRIIKENLAGRLDDGRREHYNAILPEVADASSKAERRADEAEREVEKLKKIEFIRPFVGQEFEGVISGVTSQGLFVELPNTVEGFVKVTDMTDDYYSYDQNNYMLIGRNFSKCYKLGQKVKIRVNDADKIMRTVEFLLVGEF